MISAAIEKDKINRKQSANANANANSLVERLEEQYEETSKKFAFQKKLVTFREVS